jgi:hypothetical protein
MPHGPGIFLGDREALERVARQMHLEPDAKSPVVDSLPVYLRGTVIRRGSTR